MNTHKHQKHPRKNVEFLANTEAWLWLPTECINHQPTYNLIFTRLEDGDYVPISHMCLEIHDKVTECVLNNAVVSLYKTKDALRRFAELPDF